MLPLLWPAVIAAGITAASSAASQAGGNVQSAKEAAKSRAFTEYMMQNRYQWQVKDLKKAGLNPILATGQVPQIGASAMATQRPIGDRAVAEGLESGKKIATLEKEIKILENKVEESRHAVGRTAYQGALAEQSTLTQRAAEAKAMADVEVSQASARKIRADAALAESAIPGASAQEKLDKTKGGELLRWLNRIIRSGTGRDSTSGR